MTCDCHGNITDEYWIALRILNTNFTFNISNHEVTELVETQGFLCVG